MNTSKRLVSECVRAMRSGRVSERHVRAVLGCDGVDVSPIEIFLADSNPMVRRMAARVIGEKGNVERLVEAALIESDRSILLDTLKSLRKRESGLEKLAFFLNDKDSMVREEAISMFRESGNADCLMLLMFDHDTIMVERAKRYINEQRRHKESSDS